MKEIKDGHWDAITALALSLKPNVELIYLAATYKPVLSRTPTLHKLLDQVYALQMAGNFRNSLSLQHLKTVRQDDGPETVKQSGIGSELFASLLSIPSVDCYLTGEPGHFTGRLTVPGTIAYRNSTSIVSFPHIRNLSMRFVRSPHSRFISGYLGRFHNLQKLCFDMSNVRVEDTAHNGNRPLPINLINSIGHLKSSLQSLTIFGLPNGALVIPFTSLSAFKGLKILRFRASWLIGIAEP